MTQGKGAGRDWPFENGLFGQLLPRLLKRETLWLAEFVCISVALQAVRYTGLVDRIGRVQHRAPMSGRKRRHEETKFDRPGRPNLQRLARLQVRSVRTAVDRHRFPICRVGDGLPRRRAGIGVPRSSTITVPEAALGSP